LYVNVTVTEPSFPEFSAGLAAPARRNAVSRALTKSSAASSIRDRSSAPRSWEILSWVDTTVPASPLSTPTRIVAA
jgi:hypothetical protein